MADLLIIDDDLDGADALAAIMRAEGHHVRIGYNGEDGLRLAGERLPDLALLDVEMPVLSGPEMAYEMFVLDMGRERVPIVFLSGVTDLRDVARRVGTPYCLAKPYRHSQVVALVNLALQERIAPRPPDAFAPVDVGP
jgi:DNA-binding response OmpR family regulator